jgi:hypothetical protein
MKSFLEKVGRNEHVEIAVASQLGPAVVAASQSGALDDQPGEVAHGRPDASELAFEEKLPYSGGSGLDVESLSEFGTKFTTVPEA